MRWKKLWLKNAAIMRQNLRFLGCQTRCQAKIAWRCSCGPTWHAAWHRKIEFLFLHAHKSHNAANSFENPYKPLVKAQNTPRSLFFDLRARSSSLQTGDPTKSPDLDLNFGQQVGQKTTFFRFSWQENVFKRC